MRRSKYGAVPTTVYGVRCASKREAARFYELSLLEMDGKIQDLMPHPKFDLNAVARWVGLDLWHPLKVGVYTADSTYIVVECPELGAPGEVIVEDVKSKPTLTTAAKLRIKIYEANTGERVRLEF